MRRVLGLYGDRFLGGMAGAVVETDGQEIRSRELVGIVPYDPGHIELIEKAIAAQDGSQDSHVDAICEELAAGLIDKAGALELIGFHGETLRHMPLARRSDQAGHAAVLAEASGVTLVSDFRSNDMELGGAGAPLLPIYLQALLEQLAYQKPVLFIDFSRTVTLTYVDPSEPDALMAFQVAPGLSRLQRAQRFSDELPIPKVAALLSGATWSDAQAAAMLDTAFASKYPPKNLKQDDFLQFGEAIGGMTEATRWATGIAAVAVAIGDATAFLPEQPAHVLLAGPGAQLPLARQLIAASLDVEPVTLEVLDTTDLGLRAEMVAFLAARVAAGLPTTFPATTGVPAPTGGGVVSRP